MTRSWVLILIAFFVGCGGGGGGGSVAFLVVGASPEAGDVETPVDKSILVVFNRPADVGTVTLANLRLERGDGTNVAVDLFVQGHNSSAVSIEPLVALSENTLHRVILSDRIRALDGEALEEKTICFVTQSRAATVRPDQVLDLGDAMNVPRYLARHVELSNGRVLIVGGFKNNTEATDTLEIYEPSTRTFRLLSARLSAPRAGHSVAQLAGGRILITGGVSTAGGVPLASTDIFSLSNEGVTPGPTMVEGRTEHASSPHKSGAQAMVSGGFDENGNARDTVELLSAGAWTLLEERLPRPMAQGFQVSYDFDKVYFSPSNVEAIGALWDGTNLIERQDGDVRFRSSYRPVGGDRFVMFGGDTRSFVTYLFSSELSWGASDFLRERRGAHTVTIRGLNGRRFLIAGGFNIAAQGQPALRTMEIYDSLDPGPFGFPDVGGSRVENVLLPIPFAGHVGFNEPDGPTVLAGGIGDGTGPHSRRVVIILDNASTPTVACD